MNASLNFSILPFDWLSANIVPIHKRNAKHLLENYRPISLTSVVVKLWSVLFINLCILLCIAEA